MVLLKGSRMADVLLMETEIMQEVLLFCSVRIWNIQSVRLAKTWMVIS